MLGGGTSVRRWGAVLAGATVVLLVLSSGASVTGAARQPSLARDGPSTPPSGASPYPATTGRAPIEPAPSAPERAVGSPVLGPAAVAPGIVNGTLDLANATRIPGALPTVNGVEPRAAVYDPANGLVYVAAFYGGLLAVDPHTGEVVAGVDIPGTPVGVVYDAANGLLYVLEQAGPGGVVVVDPTDSSVVASIFLGGLPLVLALDTTTGNLYVSLPTRTDEGLLDVIATGNDSQIGSVPLGYVALAVAYDPANALLYATGPDVGYVSVVSPTEESVVGSIPVGAGPESLAVDAANDTLYVADSASANVTVIEGGSNTPVGSIPTAPGDRAVRWDGTSGELAVLSTPGPGPGSNLSLVDPSNASTVAVVPLPEVSGPPAVAGDDGRLYIGTQQSNLTVVDPRTASVQSTIRLGAEPNSVQVDPTTGELLVTDRASDQVLAIDPADGAVLASLPSGLGPVASVFDPGSGYLYVADASGSVRVLDPSQDRTVGTIAVGREPNSLALDLADGRLFVANSASSNISVIATSNDSVTASIPLPTAPVYLAYDPVDGRLYVTSELTTNLTVISAANASVLGTIGLVCYAGQLVVDGENGELFALCSSNGGVYVIDPGADEVAGAFLTFVGYDTNPEGAVVDPANGYLYDVFSSFSIGVIDPENGSFLGEVDVGVAPIAVAYDGLRGSIFVANMGSGSLSEVSPRYYVSFAESGLPAHLLAHRGWTVELGGVATRVQGSPATATFAVANGSYPYLIAGPHGYQATGVASTGTLLVDDAAVSEHVTWVRGPTVRLRFHEAGLAPGTRWCVSVDGEAVCSSGRTVALANLTGGSYAYAVTSPLVGETITVHQGRTVLGPTGTLTLTRSTTLGVTFVYPYEVTFVAAGLGSTPWSVTLHGVTLTNATGGPIVFELPNGTYHVKVGPEAGLAAKVAPTPVRVAGAPTSVSVTFTSRR
jgi:YVTN family beta-propeller protein